MGSCFSGLKARQRHDGFQDMAKDCGKMPGAIVVGPASRTTLDVNEGADKSTSSWQAPDGMVAPNQAMDNTTVTDSLMDIAPLSRQSKDVTIVEAQLNQRTDVTTAAYLQTDPEIITDSRYRSDTAWNEDEQRDFSALPEFIWVTIVSFLIPRDRLALSMSCHKLHDILINATILWRSASIHILAAGFFWGDLKMKLSTADMSVLKAHCHQMTNVVLEFDTLGASRLSFESCRLLCQVARRWPLKQLEIRTTLVYSSKSTNKMVPESMQQLLHTCFTSARASNLSSLKIWINDWKTEQGKSGVLTILEKSVFSSSLTHLHFDWVNVCGTSELSNVTGRFPNLQYLSVPFAELSTDLLNTLPKHMKEIIFIVSILDEPEPKEDVDWQQTLILFPQLTVGLIFVGIPPFFIIPHMFPPIVRISSIKIKDVQCLCGPFQRPLLELLPKHFMHIKTLHCRYHQSTKNMSDALVSTVSQCPNLDQLDYSGSIRSDAVLTLAAMRPWRVLQFNAAFIVFKDSNDREKELLILRENVSMALGRKWKPSSWNQSPSDTRSTPVGLCIQAISITPEAGTHRFSTWNMYH